jgi:hypothetical protein
VYTQESSRRNEADRGTRTPGVTSLGWSRVASWGNTTLPAMCKCECHSRILAPTQKKTPAWVEIRRLEVELDAELQLPSDASCTRDNIESWVGNILVRRIPCRRIKDIETLEAEFESVPFIDGKFFEQ